MCPLWVVAETPTVSTIAFAAMRLLEAPPHDRFLRDYHFALKRPAAYLAASASQEIKSFLPKAPFGNVAQEVCSSGPSSIAMILTAVTTQCSQSGVSSQLDETLFSVRHDGAMGLDLVELVLRTEEVFSVDLPDEECELIRTVGDLYRLILDKLKLPYFPSSEVEAQSLGMERALTRTMRLSPWTTPDVWLTLKAVIHDQLGIKASHITESATFLDDLGCD